jgi:hypothetical protein
MQECELLMKKNYLDDDIHDKFEKLTLFIW